jgi:hypothetical protein
VGFIADGVGASYRTVQSKLRDTVSVKDFGAVGDGVADDTAAIQAALTYYGTQIAGNTTVTAGYVGDTLPILLFQEGTYLCGEVNMPSRIRIRCEGRAVIQSRTGTDTVPAGYWSDDVVINGEIDGLSFLYYDTVFRWQTNNTDISFHTLKNITVAKCNKLLDQVSFAASRSTTTLIDRLRASYGVPQIARIYSDKSSITNSWLVQDSDGYLFFIDSFCSFKNNILVPVGTGTGRAVIWFESTDATRSLILEDTRFGGEAGQAAIVVIGNVNAGGASDSYRQQGVTFRRCDISSNKNYDPDSIGAVNANVILRPTIVGGNKSINYVKFEECYAGPDKSNGIVQYYGTADVTTLLRSDFVIECDAASYKSFTRGANTPASTALDRYVVGGGANIQFGLNKGLDFSLNANATEMTSELFNDYEEGTWTPVLRNSSGVLQTLTTAIGTYRKIGSQVTVWFKVVSSDDLTDANYYQVGGLPFGATIGTTPIVGMAYAPQTTVSRGSTHGIEPATTSQLRVYVAQVSGSANTFAYSDTVQGFATYTV